MSCNLTIFPLPPWYSSYAFTCYAHNLINHVGRPWPRHFGWRGNPFFRKFYKSVIGLVFELLLFVICFCLNFTTFYRFFPIHFITPLLTEFKASSFIRKRKKMFTILPFALGDFDSTGQLTCMSLDHLCDFVVSCPLLMQTQLTK